MDAYDLLKEVAIAATGKIISVCDSNEIITAIAKEIGIFEQLVAQNPNHKPGYNLILKEYCWKLHVFVNFIGHKDEEGNGFVLMIISPATLELKNKIINILKKNMEEFIEIGILKKQPNNHNHNPQWN